jgi:hypothetical protein
MTGVGRVRAQASVSHDVASHPCATYARERLVTAPSHPGPRASWLVPTQNIDRHHALPTRGLLCSPIILGRSPIPGRSLVASCRRCSTWRVAVAGFIPNLVLKNESVRDTARKSMTESPSALRWLIVPNCYNHGRQRSLSIQEVIMDNPAAMQPQKYNDFALPVDSPALLPCTNYQ